MSIKSILDELAATASTKEKEAIIRREKDNELLKQVFQAAYHPMITYGIKQIPSYIPDSTGEGIDLMIAIRELSRFSSRSVTGNAASSELENILSNLDADDAVVFERIIQRDLRCGTSDSLASRVWPGIVPTFDVMLAHKDISGIKYPCYGQLKYDGARCHLFWNGTTATAFARSGKEFKTHGVFDETFKRLGFPAGTTLDGEFLVVKSDGKFADRQTGNGILNKANKGTISLEEAKSIVFMCWDVVDFSSTIPYNERLKAATDYIGGQKGNIYVVDTVIINNVEEAQEYFEKALAHKYEGAMMKNITQVWMPKRVKGTGKMKAEETADLKIVGIEDGTGKYKGMVGSYTCQTEDGLLEVNVGTGLTDDDRKNPLEIGTVIEVMYNQKITSKDKDTASLFLPRFVQARFDKTVANKLEELK